MPKVDRDHLTLPGELPFLAIKYEAWDGILSEVKVQFRPETETVREVAARAGMYEIGSLRFHVSIKPHVFVAESSGWKPKPKKSFIGTAIRMLGNFFSPPPPPKLPPPPKPPAALSKA